MTTNPITATCHVCDDTRIIGISGTDYPCPACVIPILLGALTKIADTASRASLVQDRSVHIIKQTCLYIADEANTAIAEAKP